MHTQTAFKALSMLACVMSSPDRAPDDISYRTWPALRVNTVSPARGNTHREQAEGPAHALPVGIEHIIRYEGSWPNRGTR